VKYKVRFTPYARKQFLDAIDYIRADRPVAAASFKMQAENVLSRLENHSESGRFIPEFPELGFREVIVPPYRFFYRLKDHIVWIVGAWHEAQLPDEPGE